MNLQEVRNAISQAQKEVSTRFDFRGSSAGIVFEEGSPAVLKIAGDHQAQLNGVLDIIETKLAKRAVPINAFAWREPEALPSGGMKRQAELRQGLSSEKAKEIIKVIKALGLKVQSRIEGDTVRTAGRQIDDLQAVIQALQAKDFGVPIQVENYR